MADQRFVFEAANGKQLELKNIVDVVGMGIPPVQTANVGNGWRQDGSTVQAVWYDARVFTIMFDISARMWTQAATERRNIVRFFADKAPKRLLCTRFDGQVLALDGVRLVAEPDHSLGQIPFLENTLQFISGDPYFNKRMAPSSIPLEVAVLEWPSDGMQFIDTGMEYSSATNQIVIVNNGDVPADTIIRFAGPAVTPYIENITTGARIEVSRELTATDVLEIDSKSGRVDIVDVYGDRHNAFNYLADTSDFIQLEQGGNMLSFGSAGGEGTLSVGVVEYYASL